MIQKLIAITSSDKIPELSTSNSDFTVQLKDSTQTQAVESIAVKSVTVPNVFYNVRSDNNTIIFEDSALGDLSVTVTPGQYDIKTLITATQTAINAAASGTVAIAQDALTLKLVFTFTAMTGSIKTEEKSTMAPVLGFTADQALQAVLTADSLPDLSGITNVYIHSRDLADKNGLDAGFGLTSLLETVSFDKTPFGSYKTLVNADLELATIRYGESRNISTIRIVLRDQSGRKLNIGASQMTVIIKVNFV